MTLRTQGVSGTEVAALFGMSPYLTKMGLYARKKGLVDDVKPTERMRLGKKLEPVVVQLFEEASGEKVEWQDALVEHPKEPLIIGSPDGGIVAKPQGFEAKTAGLDRAFEWGDEGTDHIPQHYVLQCQHYMMLKGFEEWHLAALIGGNDFRTFRLQADKELQSIMLDEVRKFWHDHIEKDQPPEIDWSNEAKQYLLRKYPSPTEGLRESNLNEDELILGILQTRKELAFLEKRKDELSNKLKDSIGFARGLTSVYGKASWYETQETQVQAFTRKAGRTLRVYGRKGELE